MVTPTIARPPPNFCDFLCFCWYKQKFIKTNEKKISLIRQKLGHAREREATSTPSLRFRADTFVFCCAKSFRLVPRVRHLPPFSSHPGRPVFSPPRFENPGSPVPPRQFPGGGSRERWDGGTARKEKRRKQKRKYKKKRRLRPLPCAAPKPGASRGTGAGT